MKNTNSFTSGLAALLIILAFGCYFTFGFQNIIKGRPSDAVEQFDSIVAMSEPEILTGEFVYNSVDISVDTVGILANANCNTTIRSLYNDTKEQFVFLVELKPARNVSAFMNTTGKTFISQRLIVICELQDCNMNLTTNESLFYGTSNEDGIVALTLRPDQTMRMQSFMLFGDSIPEVKPIFYNFYNDD